jgi:hypothetical protein
MSIYKYLVKSEYFTADFIKEQFDKRGNWIEAKDNIDFLYLTDDFFTDKKYYHMKVPLKNGVNDDKNLAIKYKDQFNTLLSNSILKKYIPKTYNIDLAKNPSLEDYKKYFTSNKIYIAKIANMGAGMNISIITNFKDFLKYISKYIDILKKKPHVKMNKFVLQEYITNPLLITIDGLKYKFHIRHYLFYHHKYACYMKRGSYVNARKPYQNDNYDDKHIHDTHFYGEMGYIWPDDMTDIPEDKMKYIDEQIHEFYKNLVKVYKPKCYPENKDCFELFGVDMMITDEYKLLVIEINHKIGMTKIKNNETDQINKDRFNSIMYYIVDKIFPPKYKQPDPKLCIQL